MASQELADLLLLARQTRPLETPAVLLSQVLHVLCRERSQPLDPDYVSEPACLRLLSTHPEVLTLLEKAVETGIQEDLWNNPHLAFEGVDLRSYRKMSKADVAVWKDVAEILEASAEGITKLASENSPVDTWQPTTSLHAEGPETAQSSIGFIQSLEIPKASDAYPCLLMHRLGSLIDEDRLADRVNNIFVPDKTTILVNSSGSGKTRLLLEGLCQRWGVYMTCAAESSGVGGSDASFAMSVELQGNKHFKSEGKLGEGEIEDNRFTAKNTFSRLLLSRLLLLHRFLQAVPASARHTNETRQKWLYLHVLPKSVGCDHLLSLLKQRLTSLTSTSLRFAVIDALLKVRALLGTRDFPIFCVADECQVADQMYPGAFGDNTTTLHQMALAWEANAHMPVVLCGTEANLAPLIGPAHPNRRVCTDTGAFDTPDDQRRYVTQYMPPDMVSSSVGTSLIARMWSWLRGRHRFTAAFIACLLMTQFEQPHELLNAYIVANLRVNPIDKPARAGTTTLKKASRDLVSGFTYFTGESLLYDARSYFSAHYAIHRILLGYTSATLTDNCFPLVAHGLACFIDGTGKEVRVYEPTVLCPLLQPVFHESGVVDGFLADVMAARLREAPTRNSMLLALASLFLHAFKDGPRPLTDLFLFPVATPDWVTQTAQLVRLGRRTTQYQSSYATAKSEDVWITDSPSWLQHQREEPFCDASGFSAADLLFVLRLNNHKCLHVAVAVILRNGHVDVSRADIERKLHSLAPPNIFSEDARATTTGSLSFPQLRVKALAAGDPPVLRVVTTFPYEMEINDVRRDKHAQPIAAINMATMREVAGSISPADVGRRLMAVLTRGGGKKRKYADDEETHRPKRMTTRLSEKQGPENRQGTMARPPKAPTERPARDTTKRKAPKKVKGPTPKETKKAAASQTQETRSSLQLPSRG
ncbi:hypothetical protein EV122DRAFT_295146 [Schizophyllum commune]